MPKTRSETKEAVIYLRVTNPIKELVKHQAAQEGISPSEWLRKLVIEELRERHALQTTFKTPTIGE